MPSIQDSSIGIANESVYKTGVVVTRWYEHISETLDWTKSIKQGQGLRVGGRVPRSGRRVVTSAQGAGDIAVECVSKGMGLLWQACLGAGVSTLLSGTTYQQNFTLADNPTSLTIQKGTVRVDPITAAGTVDAQTYLGCMVDSWELAFANDDIVQLTATINAGDLTPVTAYAAPSYPSSPNLFHFANGSIASGTLTPPAATTLAAGTTVVADVRGGTVSVNNALATRLNVGGAGRQAKPIPGLRTVEVHLDAEYDSVAYRDAVLNETPMALILNFTAGPLSSQVEQLQVVIPEIKLDSEMAKSNATDLIVQSLTAQGLDNLTATQPLWVIQRTADNAL